MSTFRKRVDSRPQIRRHRDHRSPPPSPLAKDVDLSEARALLRPARHLVASWPRGTTAKAAAAILFLPRVQRPTGSSSSAVRRRHLATPGAFLSRGRRRRVVLGGTSSSRRCPSTLVAAGARGDTRRQLLEFLGSSSTELVRELNGLEQTSFACGVWVDRRRAVRPEFVAIGASRYAAVAEFVDFVKDAEQARRRVNAFVRDATNNLIDDVLPPGSVRSSTVVVLANALYFNGTWSEEPFDPSATFEAPFHALDGTIVNVLFMTSTNGDDKHIAVYQGFKALKLPYESDNGDGVRRQAAAFYMLLLLPDNNSTATLELSDLYGLAVSTPGFIKNHTPAAKVPVGRFMVPKFKFTFEFEASSDMRKLGLTKPFDGGDFSGMVSSEDELRITGVYHKATVEVNELGTVAAAATAILMDGSSARMAPAPRPRVDFVVDRPFLFAIVEERSSTVMFIGHVVNPLDH